MFGLCPVQCSQCDVKCERVFKLPPPHSTSVPADSASRGSSALADAIVHYGFNRYDHMRHCATWLACQPGFENEWRWEENISTSAIWTGSHRDLWSLCTRHSSDQQNCTRLRQIYWLMQWKCTVFWFSILEFNSYVTSVSAFIGNVFRVNCN